MPRRHRDLDVPLVSCGDSAENANGVTNAGGGVSPEAQAGIFARITFSWMSRLIAEGYSREVRRSRNEHDSTSLVESSELQALTEADLYDLRPDDAPELLRQRATTAWEAEMEKDESQRSLRRALTAAFGSTFVFAGCFKFVYDSLQMVGPLILKQFLGYLNQCDTGAANSDGCEASHGLLLVGGMLLTSLLQTTVLHQYFHRCYRTGMRLNAACTCLIYSKSLKLAGPGRAADTSTDGHQQRTSGEIVNLMSVDSQRVQDTMTYLHTIWSGPYQITITLIFLANVVGWATLAGLAVMLLQIPLLGIVSRRSKMAQRTLMKAKDERIKVTNEVFSAIRLLKMYGWEDSFQNRIDTNREAELKQLKKYQILNIVSSALMSTAPILTGVSTFAVYTAIHGELTAAVAFTSLSLFNVLRFPLAVFPMVVTSAVEANVALKRIGDFLGSPQIRARPSSVLDLSEGASITEPVKLAVQIEGARLEWPNGRPLLEDVNLSIPAAVPSQERGHLTVVLGAVGVGKSGLLQALIGDLTPVLGRITLNGTIAYTSQVSWIRNQTVKDNIIFNSDVNEDRYQAVIKACALQPDLEALPSGETTEIGEKGVNISGGQKQRVSLARAVYAAPDILLLDDPLSAVDSEVSKKLLTMLRSPLLRMSSILLCTHHVAAVKHADQIVVLDKGGAPSMAHEDDAVEPPAGDGSQAAPARVAFCGSLEEFVAKYPEMAKHEQDFARQLTPEESAAAAQKKPADATDKARLVEREVERVGSVPFHVYRTYMDAAGGPLLVVGVLFGVLFGQALQTGADSWVSFWSDHSSKQPGQVYVSGTTGILGYALMSLAAFLGIFSASGCFRLTALNAARWFHQQLLERLLQQPMSFFDTTPLGRILNRFSKDIYTIDEQLQSTLYMYLQTLTRVFATVAVITVATPWFLVVIVPLLWVYRWTQNYYIPSSRQLKRIESSLRSPVFSHFSESLDGVASIRAFGQQSQFLAENADRVRRNMRAYYLNVSSNRWLAVRLETLGSGIVTSAGLFAVLARDTLSAGVAGLSISYALSVTQSLNWVVRMTSEREANIVSVERVREYVQLDCEPPHRLPDDPPQDLWPTQGCIEFKDVQLRYRQNLPLVLDGFSLRVEPREKLGICGRTGAGKSSVLNVLLRIVDPEAGRTEIDGVDIAALGLHRLRQSISIIPQEPVLFSGQLRFNLDPLAEASDGDIWKALNRAHLAKHVETLAAHDGARCFDETRCLDAAVAEGGQNFSLGQRQQMCLARALIRSNRILLLDEATSAVDMETDSLIQDTIRKEFAQHTVLCIAHRISTIIESDRVCVVERGRIAELGAPRELLKVEGSRFQQLARLDGSA